MGRGFGRGSRVTVITHSQGGHSKKVPRGLRGSRQIKRKRFQQKHDEQAQLEKSLGAGPAATHASDKSLAQQISCISFPHVVNRRQKGYKKLRKQIIKGVRSIRRKHAEKAKKMLRKKVKVEHHD
uniref:Uncharacterized protein n=1 Tax=Trypanosoma congolense (strain IL3000) TaxID=1068625 RepID=G0UMD7_TRYCI|nr:conserved hypothetical protein [Trypanosoma congolense IL3000]